MARPPTMREVLTNPPVKMERRRGTRFTIIVPVQAKWQESSGQTVVETAQTREVNAQGGLLEMKAFPRVGTQLELTNQLTKETRGVRVVAVRRGPGHLLRVAVALLMPSESFWGVHFQLKKTSSELLHLEDAIRSGGIDQRILKDFRDAVDHVRKTAWAVQEWQERQIQHHDPHTVLPLLTGERIRRAAHLSKAIISDLAAHDVTPETAGVRDLFESTTRMHQLLADLLKHNQS